MALSLLRGPGSVGGGAPVVRVRLAIAAPVSSQQGHLLLGLLPLVFALVSSEYFVIELVFRIRISLSFDDQSPSW